MLIALCRTSVLLLAGHTSTHTPQPVQSSGATWIVSRYPWISLERKGLDLNVSGAVQGARLVHLHADGGVGADDGALAAVDAGGIEDRDLLGDGPLLIGGGPAREGPVDRKSAHWKQIALPGDQPGRHPLHEVGAVSGPPASDRRVTCAGVHPMKRGERAVDGREVPLDDRPPALAVGLLHRLLDRAMASSAGSTPASWKKQGCITVLMRLPMPPRHAVGVDDPQVDVLVDQLLLDRAGSRSHTSSGP